MTTIAAIHQAPGPVPGLYDVTMEDGSMREDVTLGQLVEMLRVVPDSYRHYDGSYAGVAGGSMIQPPSVMWGSATDPRCAHGMPFTMRCLLCNPLAPAAPLAVAVIPVGSDEVLAALGRVEALLQRLVDRQD